ncbi:IclR family transcriptional regulator [Bordetella sp. N]|uniref:IclR family transcriptional regulator n=1 Tax=Bordetella sp. N TaxID=1746199 RepID=UPI0009EC0D0B|nr:IclR family transcriptional regulator [Bordetella sp. N]
MTVLQAVADASAAPAMADLVRRSGYPRPTVYRIVAALLDQGMLAEAPVAAGVPGPGASSAIRTRVVADPAATTTVTTRYRLGPRLIQLASRAWSQLDLRSALADDLSALRDETGETVHLSVPAGREMIYIDKLESQGPVRMASRVGGRLALHSSAAGKAYMAALPLSTSEALVEQLVLTPGMPNTITRPQDLREELARVRAQGYAVDNEENERGIVCYGVAIAGPDGRPLACVSVSTLNYRQQGVSAQRYVEPLLRLRDVARQRLALPMAMQDAGPGAADEMFLHGSAMLPPSS